MLPYLALALYIISLIVSLILMLTAKRISSSGRKPVRRWFKIAAILHLVFLSLFCIGRFGISNQGNTTAFLDLSFLIYFCSGTALCGWALRTSIPLIAKIYFFLFNASLILFILMPFNFSIFLLTGGFGGSMELKFPINKRYSIMEQGTMAADSKHPVYRVVKHSGMFNQTVQYNLHLGGTLDSIQVLKIIGDKSALIKVYISNPELQGRSDSSEVEVKFKQEKKDEIQRKI